MLADLQGPVDSWIAAFAAVDFANHLLLAGQTERAEKLLLNSLEVLETHPMQLQYAHTLLGSRQEALNIMRDAIEGRRDHIIALWYLQPEYDALRDDPEFQALTKILDDRITAQRERIREMEQNGELPPPPVANPAT